MTLAAILFGVAALGGVAMAIIRFSGKELPPMGLAILHGVAAAAGLIALIVAVMGGASSKATIALVLFLGAAIGGFVMFSHHLRRKALPIPYVVIHGLVAVVAFVVLLLAVFAART
ncbi:MAG: hypothetical protein ACJ74J_16070 [Blastocatellia bacterium]